MPTPADVRSFEGVGWTTSTGAVTYDAIATQGARSLKFQGGGYAEFTAVNLGRIDNLSQGVKFQVWLPTAVNPSWAGDVSVYLTSPGRNIWRAYVGPKAFQGLPTNAWNSIQLAVPDSVRTQFGSGPIDDLQISIALNLPAGAGIARIDDLRFGNEGSTSVNANGPALVTQVMSMENPSADWTLNAGGRIEASTTTRTGGNAAMRLVGIQNWTPVVSRRLTKPAVLSSNLAFDLLLPPSLATSSPYWFGQAQLYIESPSLGIYNLFIGAQELTGLPLDAFQTLRFVLPDDVVSKLRDGNYSDLFFTIVINAPSNNTGAFVLDELRFAPDGETDVPPPSPTVPGTLPEETVAIDVENGALAIVPTANGNFSSGTTIAVPELRGATASCVTDVDGNGTPDIVFANPQTHKLSFLRRLDIDAAIFATSDVRTADPQLPAGRPGPMVCGDVDGDGDVDLVTSFPGLTLGPLNPTLPFVGYINDGHGNFTRTQWDSGVSGSAELAGKALADVNLDGKLDLVVFGAKADSASSPQIFVFTNTGNRATPFSASSRSLVATPAALMDASGPNWGSLALGDFTQDGLLDLWALGNNGQLYAFKGLGGGTFGTGVPAGTLRTGHARSEIGASDLNHDGIADLLVGIWPDGYPNRPSDDSLIAQVKLSFTAGWFAGGIGGIISNLEQLLRRALTLSFQNLSFPFSTTPPPATGVGLVKDKAIPSPTTIGAFLFAVNGHLLERRFGSPVDTANPPPAGQPRPALRWSWIDYGAPPGSIVDATPALAVTTRFMQARRWLFVVGLNGHLYKLDVDPLGATPPAPAQRWTDLGLPPPITDGPPPLTQANATFDDIRAAAIALGGLLPPSQRPLVGPLLTRASRASNGVRPTFVSSPTVIVNPDVEPPLLQVFALDSIGRLNRFDLTESGGGWAGHHGKIGQVNPGDTDSGWLGDGAPRAVTWRDGTRRFTNVYVVDGKRRFQRLDVISSTWQRLNVFDQTTCNTSSIAGLLDCVNRQSKDGAAGTPAVLAWNSSGARGAVIAVRSRDSGTMKIGVQTASDPATFVWRDVKSNKQLSTSPNVVFEGLGTDPELAIFGGQLVMVNRGSILKQLLIAQRPLSTTTTRTSTIFPKIDPAFPILPMPPTTVTITMTSLLTDPLPWTFNEFPGPTGHATPTIVSASPQPQNNQQLKLWAIGGDGIFLDADFTPPSTFNWHDQHKDADTPAIVLSNNAIRRGGCRDQSLLAEGESIFPQWAPVVTPDTAARYDADSSKRPCRNDTPECPNCPGPVPTVDVCPLDTDRNSSFLYPDGNFNQGFNAEKPRMFAGTVLRSHISALDTPLNHTVTPGVVPAIAHDWNILIAPDVQYQHMLSEANLIDEGGQLEVEWEQNDQSKLPVSSLPSRGDHMGLRGRWIYDCGHPPFKTEIHPPSSAVSIHNNVARLVFSSDGGPVWFGPADPLLPGNLVPNPFACSLLGRFGDALSSLDFGDLVDILFTIEVECDRHFDLGLITPTTGCYTGYNHTMPDILHEDEPLVFDVPLPPHPTESAPSDAFVAANARLRVTSAIDSRVSVVLLNNPPRFHVEWPPQAMPTAFTQRTLTATWINLPSSVPQNKILNVCFGRSPSGPKLFAQHDDFDGDIPFIPDTCDQDHQDEPDVYYSANSSWAKIPGVDWTQRSICTSVVVQPNEDLRISTHGFECDFSCAEWPDSGDPVGEPDDRIGTVDLVLSSRENWGIGTGFGQTLSQPDLTSDRSRADTPADYLLAFQVNEVIVGAVP